ncbi:hypothetical protein F2Q69_00005974 [Brassica cretica]|uniref:Uncharacterized protein n=1 Tax=Brassica cretica TaxID=69181 RepID=A0A8S9P0G6_BRACR|nr:hypothetical protein F2Q69_00005974 [Brassica cretica]
MSTNTLQAQGQRSTVALHERTKAQMECRPGAKSNHIAPYARGTKVIGKVDGEAHQHPGTNMFQKGIPQNLRVPSEQVPQTLGFSILESRCRFFRRSFSSRYPIMGHISKKSCARKKDLAYHCNANPRLRIPTSERGNISPTADFN